MPRWRTLWSTLTSPAKSITNHYERERATAYSALLCLAVFALLVASITTLIVPIISQEMSNVLIISTICFAFLYLLSRTAYYGWSVRLYVWISAIIILYTYFNIELDQNEQVLNFLVIPMMLSAFILNKRDTLFNIAILWIATLVAQYMHPQYGLHVESTPLLIILTGILTVIVAGSSKYHHRKAISSEVRYRSLMEANYEGILVIDHNSAKILDLNSAALQILGYTAEEIIGRYPIELVVEKDKLAVSKIWDERLENIPIELDIIHKHNIELTVEARLRAHYFNNQPAYVITLLDISERKQAEAFLIESEARFRAIFNESIYYLGILDNTGKIMELNDLTYERFGYQHHQVIGKYLWEFEPWVDSEKSNAGFKNAIQLASRGMSSRYEIQAHDKYNKTIYIDFAIKMIEDLLDTGESQLIIIEGRDVTHLRKIESQQREFEQRYQTLFNNTNDAVFVIGMDGQLLDANQRAEDILATSRETILASKMQDFVADEEKTESKLILDRMTSGDYSSSVAERRMRRANGALFYAETFGVVVADEQGKARYILSMVRDITERKQLEQERFKSALDHERTQLLAHFIENASHHFRTPITNMKTRMYLLPRLIENPEKRDEQVDILNQELERLQNILDDLLTVLRLQKDDTEYNLNTFSVNQLLSEVHQAFKGRSGYANFNWQWELNENNALIYGDKVRLGRAIINMVHNAMIFTPEQGEIIIRSFTHEEYIAIEVIDSGQGISESDLPHVFEDFYRGQDAMEQDSTSSGLGLTITKMIVERHQGRVYAANRESGGAKFQILLPQAINWGRISHLLPADMLTNL